MSQNNASKRTVKNTAIITTVFNERTSIIDFLHSIFSMESEPEEMILVDGGSTDGTIELVNKFIDENSLQRKIKFIVDDRASLKKTPGPIAKGRNIAIENTNCKYIAATDAGCVVTKNWLDEITKPFFQEKDVDVVAGWYESDPRSYFEKCAELVWISSPEYVNPEKVDPSSRSIAFKRSAWKSVGGYPENSLWGEDTLFNLKLRQAGKKFSFNNKAIVKWKSKSDLKSFYKLSLAYGFGDGFNFQKKSNLMKNFAKGLIAILLSVLSIGNLLFVILLVLFLIAVPFFRKRRRLLQLSTYPKIPVVILLKIISDIGYTYGYLKGIFTSNQPKNIRNL